jgi:alpha-galactosidase
MKKLKIVIIGAGSAGFGRGAVADIFSHPELAEFDLTVSLVDIDAEALKRMTKLAHQIRDHYKAKGRIEASIDREEVLPGADYIIVSVARDRWKMWEKDFYIPAAYGFRHVDGENGGPGAVFHTLRSLHLMIPMARDIERLCPDAYVLNYTNPESRVILGISKLTKVRSVGLCHGVYATWRHIARVLEMDMEKVDLTIGGINHFHWALEIKEKATGKDLKPEFDRRMQEGNCGFDPLTRRFYDLFGYLTYPAPTHPGEYVTFAHNTIGPVFLNWGIGPVSRRPSETAEDKVYTRDGSTGHASYELWSLDQAVKIQAIADGKAPLTEEFAKPTTELAVPIICDVEFDKGRREISVNVPNTGFAIDNMPEDAIIEVPGIVDSRGVKPVKVGPLPEAIAALCKLQAGIQNLIVEGYRERSKKLLLQALVIDPCVDSVERAEAMMERMLRIQADYLPEFR